MAVASPSIRPVPPGMADLLEGDRLYARKLYIENCLLPSHFGFPEAFGSEAVSVRGAIREWKIGELLLPGEKLSDLYVCRIRWQQQMAQERQRELSRRMRKTQSDPIAASKTPSRGKPSSRGAIDRPTAMPDNDSSLVKPPPPNRGSGVVAGSVPLAVPWPKTGLVSAGIELPYPPPPPPRTTGESPSSSTVARAVGSGAGIGGAGGVSGGQALHLRSLPL